MTEQKKERPRLLTLLTFLLLLQAPVIVFLGLNLLTRHWTFLFSWTIFWEDIREAFSLMVNTPGEISGDEILFYEAIAFILLLLGAIAAIFAGLTFNGGKPISWILSLFAQIATLVAGIGLYLILSPAQAYWLIAIGILMVLYLNYGSVRQWFLQSAVIREADQDA